MSWHLPLELDAHPTTSVHPPGHCGHEQLQRAYLRICQHAPVALIPVQLYLPLDVFSIPASSSVQLAVSDGAATGAAVAGYAPPPHAQS